jgi:hypothetical protein
VYALSIAQIWDSGLIDCRAEAAGPGHEHQTTGTERWAGDLKHRYMCHLHGTGEGKDEGERGRKKGKDASVLRLPPSEGNHGMWEPQQTCSLRTRNHGESVCWVVRHCCVPQATHLCNATRGPQREPHVAFPEGRAQPICMEKQKEEKKGR